MEYEFRRVPLTKNRYALVDPEDYERVMTYLWCAYRSKEVWYAHRDIIKGTAYRNMHRFILGDFSSEEIDHIDNNGLNNQKKNLRSCTTSQNAMHRGPSKRNKSGYKGVSWCIARQKWIVQIHTGKKNNYVGAYDSKIYAAVIYDEVAQEAYGDFAYLNFPAETLPDLSPYCIGSDNDGYTRLTIRNQSGKKGVSWDANRSKWRAEIGRGNGKSSRHLGYFDNIDTAALAYDRAAAEKFGHKARLNFPGERDVIQ